MTESAPKVFRHDDVVIAWTGDHEYPLIDIDLRTSTTRPTLINSAVTARVSLTPGEAVAFAQAILMQVDRVYRKG